MGSVIFFIHDLSLTGVADNTLGLARHLAKASWDVDIVTVAATWIERGGTLSVTPLRPGCSGSRTATLRNVLPSLRRHLRGAGGPRSSFRRETTPISAVGRQRAGW